MFDLPKLPTDNLYKFQALAGLTLILVSLIYPPWLYHQSILGYLEAKKDEKELQAQKEYVQNRLKLLQARIDAGVDDPAQLKNRIDDLERQLTLTSETNRQALASEIDGLRKRWQESLQNREALIDASNELALNLRSRADELAHQESVSETEQWIARKTIYGGLILLVVGSAITYDGFRKWNLRVQMFQDAILKKEAENPTAGGESPEKYTPAP